MDAVTTRGVLVQVHGVGVLIKGPSGSGKSLAALNLMNRGHFLVADDVVSLVPDCEGKPVGQPLEQDVRIEVRGLGVFAARSLFPGGTAASCPIDLVVELDAYCPSRDLGRLKPETGSERLLDKDLLKVRVPVPLGMDCALMIELLARLYSETGTVEP